MKIILKFDENNYLLLKSIKRSENGYYNAKLSLVDNNKELLISKGCFEEEMGSLLYFRLNEINKYYGNNFNEDYEKQTIKNGENNYEFDYMYSLINGKFKLFLYKDENDKIIFKIIKTSINNDYTEKIMESKKFYAKNDNFIEWKTKIINLFIQERKKTLEEKTGVVSEEQLNDDLKSWIDCYR